MRSVDVIGVASRLGKSSAHCELGPMALHQSSLADEIDRQYLVHLNWRSTIFPTNDPVPHHSLTQVCRQLSQHTEALTKANKPFVVIGGDHSSAIGTWAGVLNALPDPKSFGLIWIDAHMDAHTFQTSPSGNIHGMPVAALLGKGDAQLKSICPANRNLVADNLLMLGIRSFESGEKSLLNDLHVKMFSSEIVRSGDKLKTLIQAFIDTMPQLSHVGVSIDLDVLDPTDAPGVGSPEPNGISATTLCDALKILNNCEKLVGIEIAEYEPTRDRQNRTRRVIGDIIGAVFGERR